MVVGLIGKTGARLGSRVTTALGSSTGRAAAAGAAGGGVGGVLLDDLPVLSNLDPTEGGGLPVNPTIIVIAVIVLGFAWVMRDA